MNGEDLRVKALTLHVAHCVRRLRAGAVDAGVLRPSKHGQFYRCPECSSLFSLATHKWGSFLEHIKSDHPGAKKPKRNDKGVLVLMDANGGMTAHFGGETIE